MSTDRVAGTGSAAEISHSQNKATADSDKLSDSSACNETGIASSSGSMCSPSLTLDIVNTSIITPKGPRTKFVVYFLHLHPSRSVLASDDCYNDCIERRYTDFRSLHKKLTRAFPVIMSGLVFPKKLYSGNFNPENIARRSQAFEQYLCHLLDIPEIRFSGLFSEFFYLKELKDGMKSFSKAQYSVVISKMSKAARNVKLTLSPTHSLVTLAYAVMVSCHTTLEDYFECYESALNAIASVPSGSDNSLVLPLLIRAVHMAVSLGKPKAHLEQRISDLQSKSDTSIEDIPTLQETLLQEMEHVLVKSSKS